MDQTKHIVSDSESKVIVTEDDCQRFAFGKNWEDFVRNSLTEERIEIATKHLLDFLEVSNLNGLSFIDIGSGSGIHSLAAYRSRAASIISFDVDPDSFKTSLIVSKEYGKDASKKWQVIQGSILDEDFLSSLPQADLVYSWGVLHHTGDLWKSISNSINLVKPGGRLYIAIYVKDKSSEFWIKIKKLYNRSNSIGKCILEFGYVLAFFAQAAFSFKLLHRIKYVLNYKKSRGMAFLTDVRDWLGGWPYQPATEKEICEYCQKLGLQLMKVKTGEANIEYLFKKP